MRVEGTVALLRVADDGPGMPRELHQEAFNRFSRRAGSPGTGLGLTLIHQQVVLHGGTVEIEPSSGRGLSVLVQMPIAWRPDGPSDGLSWLSLHQKVGRVAVLQDPRSSTEEGIQTVRLKLRRRRLRHGPPARAGR